MLSGHNISVDGKNSNTSSKENVSAHESLPISSSEIVTPLSTKLIAQVERQDTVIAVESANAKETPVSL